MPVTKDWFIQEFRKPGFTIELGLGVNPLPISQFDEIYRESLGIFLAGLYINLYFLFTLEIIDETNCCHIS